MRTIVKVIFGLCILPVLSVHAGNENLPGLAKQMKSKYERDVAFAVAPIEERYVKDLTSLCKDLTRSSDLDGALAVKQELTDVLLKPFVGSGLIRTALLKSIRMAQRNLSPARWEGGPRR